MTNKNFRVTIAPPDGGFSTMMLMMVGWMVVATALYLLRPRSLRQRGDLKPDRNNVCSFLIKTLRPI
jgi:hypothetical protein